jgi:hypothetical protein
MARSTSYAAPDWPACLYNETTRTSQQAQIFARPPVARKMILNMRGSSKMTEIWFYATHTFSSQTAAGWEDFIRWSGLVHLARVLSLDIMLCPPLVSELIPADWDHNVHADFRSLYFRHLDYLESRLPPAGPRNLLAILLEPQASAASFFQDGRFALRGYDLVEKETGISALTNCGGFDQAFRASDLSEDGLIADYALSREVQHRLHWYYPNQHHANCELWAVWEMLG